MPTRVTIKDVAAKANVSYQTVSKVLNRQMQVSQETETRIWNAVQALGYIPDQRARNLRTQRSHMLGYSWAPSQPGQVNPILDSFLQSMMTAAEAVGYHILPFPHPQVRGHVAAYRELIHAGRVDGFIISSVEYDDPRVEFLQAENVPFVAFGRAHGHDTFAFVDVDGAAGLRAATEHLVQNGHKKIFALAWPLGSRVGENRMQGYLEALQDARIKPHAHWIVRGEGNFDFGYQATRDWLDLSVDKRPTAIVALNDSMAIGAMRAIQERGLRVGADIAVTGFDDTPLVQYLTPPLTSIRQPISQVGQHVVSILVRLIENAPAAQTQILLPPRLIVRSSSLPTTTS